MTSPARLPPWHELQRLANGRDVLIRPIRPEDALPLRAGFDLLQPDAVRERLLYPFDELTAQMAEQLTRTNPRTQFTLVVTEPLPPGEALVCAVARITIDEDNQENNQEAGRDAEFVILVSRFIAHLGVGRYLMTRLVKWARGKQVDRIYGDVLHGNEAMLSLTESLGFRRGNLQDSPHLVRVMLDLRRPRGDNAQDPPLPQRHSDLVAV